MPYVGEFSITFLNCSTVILASSAASSTDRRPFLTSSISVLILPSLKLSSLIPWLRLHIISTSFLKLLYLPQLGLKIRAQSDTSSRTVRVQGSSLPFSVTGIFGQRNISVLLMPLSSTKLLFRLYQLTVCLLYHP